MLRWITAVRESLASPAKAERRGEQRIPYKTTIEIRTADGITYRGYSRDLSLRGMGALVAASLEIGDEIWVKYDHPKRGEQISRATVRQAKVRSRLSSSRYGFEFRLPLDI